MADYENEFDNTAEDGVKDTGAQSPETTETEQTSTPTENTKAESVPVESIATGHLQAEGSPAADAPAESSAEGVPSAAEELTVIPAAELQLGLPEQNRGKKKKVYIIAAIGAGLAVVGLAIGLFAGGTPREDVLRALEKTNDESKSVSTELIRDIPILGIADMGPAKYDFDVTFEGLETPDPGLTSELSLLRGIGLRGTTAQSAEERIVEFDSSLYIGTTDLLGMYLYLSPELAASSIPTFTETAVAVRPAAAAAEIASSPFVDIVTPENAQMLQEALQNVLAEEDVSSEQAGAVMRKELQELFVKTVPGLKFEKGPKQNGLKTYLVSAPGDEMKAFLLEGIRYMVLDSPLKSMYRAMFQAYFESNGMSDIPYEELMTETIATLERDISPQAMNAVVTVDKGRASKLDITLTPEGMPNEELDIAALHVVYEMPGGVDSIRSLAMDLKLYGETITMTMDAQRVRRADKGLDMTGKIGLTTPGEKLAMDFRMGYSIDGAVDQSFDFLVEQPGVRMETKVGFDLAGTVKKGSGETLFSCEFPKIELSLEDNAAGSYTLNLKSSVEAQAIPAYYAPTRPYRFVSEMSEAEAQALRDEYNAGLGQMFGLLMNVLYGASA